MITSPKHYHLQVPKKIRKNKIFFIVLAIVFSVAFVTNLSTHKLCTCNSDPMLEELEKLAKENEMEFVIGDKFPTINPYGSYGSPYVFDFVRGTKDNPIEKSVLFLCREKRYIKEYEDPALDLVSNYSYSLVFASKMENENKFKVRNVIPDIGLKAMSLYYGSLNIDLSKLEYINRPDVKVPKEILKNFVSQSIPVLISAESSTQFLLYYRGEWLEYVERDI
jgi:hypothetical protein